ncbi:type VI immunity family protein [Archangium lansingense]|uniref:type VI immunity family protein n=1 Tax=Archangium lansingense TaxID=2995310 RepID=UPI003B797901
MTPPLPRIRHRGRRPVHVRLWSGKPPRFPLRELLARDVVRFAFYLPYDHPEIASGVRHAVESYLRAVGQGLGTINNVYTNEDEGDALTEETWSYLHHLLSPERPFRFVEELSEPTVYEMVKRGFATRLIFDGGFGSNNGYQLWYQARIPSRTPPPNLVSTLTATLPAEHLQVHGPTKVRELALEMASQLRFATGHVGLALHLYWPLRSTDNALRAELLRYPGIDLRPAWLYAHRMGTRVDGVHWLNFLAQPVLGELGGAAGLRARLQSSETTVHELDEARVVVALGEKPEAGDLSAGQNLPTYQELARALEPWLEPLNLSKTYSLDEPPTYSSIRFTQDEAKRWWRRFLD